MSINAIGGYGFDPYFMAAYQSYNPNFQGLTQNGSTKQIAQAGQYGQVAQNTTNPSFQAKPPVEKDGSAATLIVGGLATIGTGILLYKAHKKGGEKGIVEGFKQMWKGIKTKVTGSSTKETFKIQKNTNNEWICSVPGKGQRINLNSENYQETASKLGINADEIINFGGKNTQAITYEFVHNGNKIQVKRNKIVGYRNNNNEDLLSKLSSTDTNDVNYKKTLESIIAKINKGEIPDDITLNKIYYTHSQNGVTRRFVKKGDKTELNKLVTNRHLLDSDAVKSYRGKNPNIDEILKKVEDGKISETSLKIASGECMVDNTKLLIKDNEIIGVFDNEAKKFKPKGSNRFGAWSYEHQNAQDEVNKLIKENKLENVIYEAA